MLPWQQNLLHFSTPFILFDKCTKFYLILTSDVSITWDLNVKLIQVLLVMSQFFVKGPQSAQFSFRIFPGDFRDL